MVITITVELVLCYLQVVLNGTDETVEQTQLDKQWTLIHLLQLNTIRTASHRLHKAMMHHKLCTQHPLHPKELV